jgi:hypothetical protein
MKANKLVPIDEIELIIKKDWIKEVGKDIKQRVVDVDKLGAYLFKKRSEEGMSPYIDILSVKEHQDRNNHQDFKFSKDAETGLLFGIVSGLYPDGNIKWLKIDIMDYETLNLNNISDLRKWVVLRYWSLMEGSPFQIEFPIFKVRDPELEAIEEIQKATEIEEVLDLAKNLKGKEMLYFARAIGITGMKKGITERVLRGLILTRAIKEPNVFIECYKGKDRSLKEAFYNGMAVGKIQNDFEKGYVYRGVVLGRDEYGVIEYLRENMDTTREILREINTFDDFILYEEGKKEEVKVKSKKETDL